jgi:uncharacterized protein (TIGR02678 family)
VPEIRAEGIAMVDPEDDLTDLRMPEQGTHGHVTLLLAEHLSRADGPVTHAELAGRVRELAAEHGTYWAKSAREPGTENELVAHAVTRLTALGLVTSGDRGVAPRPALARYAVEAPVVLEPGSPRPPAQRKARRP